MTMRTLKDKIIEAATDYFYEKMTAFSERKNREYQLHFYTKWLKVKQRKTFEKPTKNKSSFTFQAKLF